VRNILGCWKKKKKKKNLKMKSPRGVAGSAGLTTLFPLSYTSLSPAYSLFILSLSCLSYYPNSFIASPFFRKKKKQRKEKREKE